MFRCQCQLQSECHHDNAVGFGGQKGKVHAVVDEPGYSIQRFSSCGETKTCKCSSGVISIDDEASSHKNTRSAWENIVGNSCSSPRYHLPEKSRDFDQSLIFDGQGGSSSLLTNDTDLTYHDGSLQNCYCLDDSLDISNCDSDFTWSSVELSGSDESDCVLQKKDESDCEIIEGCDIRVQWERAASWRKQLHKSRCKPDDNACHSGSSSDYHPCETTQNEVNKEHNSENYSDHSAHVRCEEFGQNGLFVNEPSSSEILSSMPLFSDDGEVLHEGSNSEKKRDEIPGEPSCYTCSHDYLDGNHQTSLNQNEHKSFYEEQPQCKNRQPCYPEVDFRSGGLFLNKKGFSVESNDTNQEENGSYEKIYCFQEQNYIHMEHANHANTSSLHGKSNKHASDFQKDLNADIGGSELCDLNMQISKEEFSCKEEAILMQVEERLRKRKQAETVHLLDIERRQKLRLEELRELQKKEEDNINLKEKLRLKVKKELESLEARCKDMTSLLRGLGIRVEGGCYPMPWEVNVAYRKALIKFHPDRASRTDMLQQIQAEETFKMISSLKENLLPVAY